MFRLIATTSYSENYGYRWKAKGGSEYVVFQTEDANVAFNMTQSDIDDVIKAHENKIVWSNDHSSSYINDVYWTDELTDYEKFCMEYEGKVDTKVLC